MEAISPAIEKFNKVMELYIKEVSETDHKDFDSIEKLEEKRQEIIKEAEQTMEKEMEEEIKKDDDRLKQEQEASEKELKDIEQADEKETQDQEDETTNYTNIEKEILANIEKGNKAKTISNKFDEQDIVNFANKLGIEAKMGDREPHTVEKLIKYFSKK